MYLNYQIFLETVLTSSRFLTQLRNTALLYFQVSVNTEKKLFLLFLVTLLALMILSLGIILGIKI